MIDDLVLKVDDVSKKYCRDLKRSLKYGIADICSDLLGGGANTHELRPSEFWAVRDVKFDLRRGESLGLIGRNGAGKTTLLKLINGLIKPTLGRITIRGTIGALIALGTGFNPILTGRENAMIAGSVLGLTDRQIGEKMEEILEFSEIGDFIDTPVKSYSSGMLVRLGFSVAIQLEPDLLLVDEVLAVGDLGFMTKCQKKITEYRNNGGSMILVSHGMHNVRFHCDRAIWLDQSRIREIDRSSDVCDQYELDVARHSHQHGDEIQYEKGVRIGDVRYPTAISRDETFTIDMQVITNRAIEKPILVLSIFDVRNQHLVTNFSHKDGFMEPFKPGSNWVRAVFEKMPLSNGIYNLNVSLRENEVNNHLVVMQNKFRFEMHNEFATLGLLDLKPRWELADRND